MRHGGWRSFGGGADLKFKLALLRDVFRQFSFSSLFAVMKLRMMSVRKKKSKNKKGPKAEHSKQLVIDTLAFLT